MYYERSYLRSCQVSSYEQATEGYSIHEQERKLKAFCEVQNWHDFKVFTDAGISGGSMNRPALKRIMDNLEYYDLVLVYKLDRLTRNVKDLLEMLETFEKYNVAFKSATEVFDTTTAIGKLFITMVGAMAEWERATIRERALFGSRAAVREGNYIREAPFCYDNVDGKLVPNEHKWVIDYLVEQFKHGVSGNEIARQMNLKKVNVPKVKKWNRTSIIRLMKNPVLRGHTKYGDMYIENTHEPVLSESDYKRIIDVIENKTHRSKVKHHAIFRGVLTCPQCHNKLHLYAGNITDKKGYSYEVRRYKCDTCSKDKNVQTISFNESEVEDKFIELLKTYDMNKFKVDIVEESTPKLDYDIDKIMKQREKLTRSWSLGYIEDDEYFSLMDETKEILDKIERAGAEVESTQTVTNEQLNMIDNILIKGWSKLNVEQKEELILSTVKEIVFDFVPRKYNENGKVNTLNIREITFKF
ncbi:MAG: recombinase family protein [Staphylococcus sp.]|nr:recombinase family protein [Staphylococcus sp.]